MKEVDLSLGTISIGTGQNWNSFVKEVTSAYAIFQPNKTNNKGGGKKRERVQDREFITQ